MTSTPPPRSVVVGYDGSAGSRAALEHAAEAAGVNGRVFVVVAYPRPHGWLGQPNHQQRLDAALDGAESIISDLREETGGPLGRVAWVSEVIGDDPARAIAAVAATRDADEIVVGSRAHGPMHALRGSVANDLIRLVDIPVTVIPQRAAEAA